MSNKKSAKKNPLYVVTTDKKGSVVEEASGLFDLFIKKLGLGDSLALMQELFARLLALVNNYAMFESVKKVIDDFAVMLNKLFGTKTPEAASGGAV